MAGGGHAGPDTLTARQVLYLLVMDIGSLE